MSQAAYEFDLLVFDWDGTLMDSVGTIVRCMQATVAELGMKPLSEERIRRTIGLGLHDTMQALGLEGDETQWNLVVERYSANWRSTYLHDPTLFEGARETIQTLHGRDYLMAVATGKSRIGLDRELSENDLGASFHATRTASDARSKPHPQMLMDILDELGVRPERALMIGDTTFDMEMARSAGTRYLAVTSGSHPEEELRELEPIACLKSVVDLPTWLDGASSARRAHHV